MPFAPTDLADALGGGSFSRRRDPFAERRKLAQQMMLQGSDASPVQSPWQGAARLAQALAGGLEGYFADRDEKASDKKRSEALADALGEQDPKKRIAKMGVIDPDAALRASGALAIEEVKQQQAQGVNREAGNLIGATFGMPGGAATGMPAPLPTGAPPAGGFNNNAGNIRVTGTPWQGEGAPHNGFKTFNTPQDGVNAMAQNYAAYVKQNPNVTVAQALSKWAPPNENNTGSYIRTITEGTGINPGMSLGELMQDPAAFAQFLEAQTRLEKGGIPQGMTPDHFTNATQPRQPAGLQINMPGPGAPAPLPVGGAAPPIAGGQGGDVVQPVQQVAGPVPPAVPDVPKPQADPQVVARAQALVSAGKMTPAEAVREIEADIKARWDRDTQRRKMEYDQQLGDYRGQREREAKQPQETFGNEGKLRDDFKNEPAVKAYREVVPIMESAKDAVTRPSRAADLNLVYALAKMMDPNSVVREGEMVMVQKTGTVADTLGSLIGSLNGGQMMTNETRQKVIQEMQSRFKGLEESHNTIAGVYGDMAQRYGLNRDNIVIPVRRSAPQGEQGQPKAAPVRIDINGKPL